MDLVAWYIQQCVGHPDISEHLPTIRRLADRCEVAAELGAGYGGVTSALLASKVRRVITVDIRPPDWEESVRVAAGERWKLIIGDSREVELPEEVDLLVIDTVHRADYLEWELDRHAHKVQRWIVLHDTEIYGDVGEAQPGDTEPVPGLRHAVYRFLRQYPEWLLVARYRNQYGLSILGRIPQDEPRAGNLVGVQIDEEQARP